jgi:hypothetical protein
LVYRLWRRLLNDDYLRLRLGLLVHHRLRRLDDGRHLLALSQAFAVADTAGVRIENYILAMKSPFSDDAAPISSSN